MVRNHTPDEVIVASPATHLPQLESDESYGTNILKGYSSGLISFGVSPEIYIGLSVKAWGNEYFNVTSSDLYIFCDSWVNFKLEKQFVPTWEVWLSLYHPKNN